MNIYGIRLPYSGDFAHSQNQDRYSRNIVVQIVAENGNIIGYGEGAPRPYVTGETLEQAVETAGRFVQHTVFPWRLNHLSQIRSMVTHFSKGKKNNAAICALELALLDTWGRYHRKSLSSYIKNGFAQLSAYVEYGAGIPLCAPERSAELCHRIQEMGITKLKQKLGPDYDQNRIALDTILDILGHTVDVKVDVNGVWDLKTGLRHLPLLQSRGIRIVEQPLGPNDPGIATLADVYHGHDMILMADESACTLPAVETLCRLDYYRMFNIRLSKCGGFFNTLKIIDFLRKAAVAYQVGCHLGESGLLSAAGRHLSLLCNDAWYHDGSYDRFLLQENLTVEDVTFGKGGRAIPLDGWGLGVEVDPSQLDHLGRETDVLAIQGP